MKKLIALAALAVAVWAGPAGAADTVKFGTIRVPAQIFIGMDKGFFAEEGIEIEPVFFKSGTEVAPALATGQIDTAFTTAGAALFNAMARGANTTIMAEALSLEPNAPGGDPTAIVASKASGVTSGADLKGKTAAVTAPGQILDLIFRTYLEKNGLKPEDVKTIGMAMPDMVPALSNGAIDAAVIIDPFLSALVGSDKATVLAHSSDVLPNASQAFLAYSDGMMQNQDLAVRFMRAYLKTNTWMRGALPTPDGRKEIAAIFQKYVPAKDASVYETIAIGTASADAKVNVDGDYGLKYQFKMLSDQGLIKGDPKLEDHINTSILAEAAGK